MIWSGAGVHALFLAGLLVWHGFGIDPDDSAAWFFVALAPVLLVGGLLLDRLTIALYLRDRARGGRPRGKLDLLLHVLAALKADVRQRATLFGIPLPALSVVSLLIALVLWADLFDL